MPRPNSAELDTTLNQRRAKYEAQRVMELERNAALDQARLLLADRHKQEVYDLAAKIAASPKFTEVLRAYRFRGDLRDNAQALIRKLEDM